MKRSAKPTAQPPPPSCPGCVTPTACGSVALGFIGTRCKVQAGLVEPEGPDECDCLNRCGDDPWLKDGRARPCQALLQQQQAAAVARWRRANVDHANKLLEELGYRDTGNGAHLVAAVVELRQLRAAKA